MAVIHTKFPEILAQKKAIRTLNSFERVPKNATKMARYFVDILFDREKILNMTLDELVKEEPDRMSLLLSFTTSYFGLTSTGEIRGAVSDKLSHFPGRTRSVQKRKPRSKGTPTKSPQKKRSLSASSPLKKEPSPERSIHGSTDDLGNQVPPILTIRDRLGLKDDYLSESPDPVDIQYEGNPNDSFIAALEK